MDIKEVKKKRDELAFNIRRLISRFQEETGCAPGVSVEYHESRAIGGPTDYIPVVMVEVRL